MEDFMKGVFYTLRDLEGKEGLKEVRYENLTSLLRGIMDLDKGEVAGAYESHLVGEYYKALEGSKKFGYVGVGCITFAEGWIAALQKLGR